MTKHQHHQQQQHTTHFQTRKANCLSKRDKSSAGRIDPRAVDICAEINAREEYYTTSSCSGRCFLYCGDGIKSWHASTAAAAERSTDAGEEDGVSNNSNTSTGVAHGFFQRTRVNHDLIHEPTRYFNLSTITTDRTGGGDPIPTIGQFESLNNNENFKNKLEEYVPFSSSSGGATADADTTADGATASNDDAAAPIWLRYEPFILHVMCRSLKAASVLMALARPSFKNVGLTSWNVGSSNTESEEVNSNNNGDANNDNGNTINNNGTTASSSKNQQCKGGGPRYLVAIWGDEGLDMPLSLPSSPRQGLFYNCDKQDGTESGVANAEWLAQLVNERHGRNWKKIERFVDAMRSLEVDCPVDDVGDDNGAVSVGMMNSLTLLNDDDDDDQKGNKSARVLSGLPIPRSYDVVGDVAILNNLPEGDDETQKKVGEWIMKKNKAIKIVVARHCALSTEDRSPGSSGLKQLAGHPRDPIVTSHYEYGIKCVVDLNHTFFSPRMAPERLRLAQQVARGERVLVVFAGVGMDALQIAARTEAKEVLVIERNAIACECIRRGKLMLSRNKTAPCPGSGKGASERMHVLEGDGLELLPTLEKGSFDRIVAPRPKEGSLDGDLGTGDAGMSFLMVMLPLLKPKGEVHWYDFAADHELPNCDRTRKTLEKACQSLGLEMEVIHVARVGSIAKRQWRVCVDFRIIAKPAASS
eukprot:scaffold237_cov146-Skeletonema_menzelii.AAC.16